MGAAAIIYIVAMLFFTIAFVAEWIRFRKRVGRYLKYGLWFSGIVITMDILLMVIAPVTWNPEILCLDLATVLRLTAFTVVGMYYATGLGYPSFPLLLQKFKPAEEETTPAPSVPVEIPAAPEGERDSSQDEKAAASMPEETGLPQEGAVAAPTSGQPVPGEVSWQTLLRAVLGASALTIIYSSILFWLTSPQTSALARDAFGISPNGTGDKLNLAGILVLLEFAIAEEICFRLGIQNFLARYMRLRGHTYWIAIVFTSALWTLGHAGVLEPAWVKYAQIFPIGLLLGWLYKKYGAGSTMLVHAIFNIGFTYIYTYLIL